MQQIIFTDNNAFHGGGGLHINNKYININDTTFSTKLLYKKMKKYINKI